MRGAGGAVLGRGGRDLRVQNLEGWREERKKTRRPAILCEGRGMGKVRVGEAEPWTREDAARL